MQIKLNAKNKELEIVNSGDLGKFYGHVNNRLFHKSGIAPLKDKEGNFVLNDLAKANLLNNYFTGVGTVDNGSTPEFVHPTIPEHTTLHTVAFNSSLILNCIKKLKNKSTAGPDGLPSLFFKKLSMILLFPLSKLFNTIMQFGELPDM